jgi:hypothetical protein
VTDAAGRLWVREPGSDDAERVWQVFDTGGRHPGAALTPAGLRVTDIAQDLVLGIARDELAVEYVRVFRLFPVQRAATD